MKYTFVPATCVAFNCKYQFVVSCKGSKVLYLVTKSVSILEESYSKGTQLTGDAGRKKHHKIQEKEIRSLAPGIE